MDKRRKQWHQILQRTEVLENPSRRFNQRQMPPLRLEGGVWWERFSGSYSWLPWTHPKRTQKTRAFRLCLTMESSFWGCRCVPWPTHCVSAPFLGLALCISCWGNPSSAGVAFANGCPRHAHLQTSPLLHVSASSSHFGSPEPTLCRLPSFPLSWFKLPFLWKHQVDDF